MKQRTAPFTQKHKLDMATPQGLHPLDMLTDWLIVTIYLPPPL